MTRIYTNIMKSVIVFKWWEHLWIEENIVFIVYDNQRKSSSLSTVVYCAYSVKITQICHWVLENILSIDHIFESSFASMLL
jgi:hypothetical protein